MLAFAMRRLLALAFLLAACGSSTDPHAREVCEKAADRWQACMKDLLGDDFEKTAAAKRDIGGCARDPRTVQMYEKCLATPDCTELMACVMGEAEKPN
jgi:hypothetical protein